MASVTDVVAYQYNADLYTPQGILAALTTNPGRVGPPRFDPLLTQERVEVHLDLLARIAGIDRYSEESFDSSEFPKVVFRGDMTDDDTLMQEDGTYIRFGDL